MIDTVPLRGSLKRAQILVVCFGSRVTFGLMFFDGSISEEKTTFSFNSVTVYH